MKSLKLKTILTLTATLFWSGVFGLGFAGNTFAGTSQNVSGWAWSSNIGWISFNCTNRSCPPTPGAFDYGVNLDESGNFSGYAWSSNIGWISFERDTTGNPPSNDPGSGLGAIAKYDSVTGKISGWARALSQDNGWDGWIRFDAATGNPWLGKDVSINSSTSEFEGWAWGSDVVGWISFNCSNSETCPSSYKVTTTSPSVGPPPDLPSYLSIFLDNCKVEATSIPTFKWKYTHPQGRPQAEFQVRIVSNDPSYKFVPKEFYCNQQYCGEVGALPDSGTANSYTYALPESFRTSWLGWARWAKTYWATIRVKDDRNRWSQWTSPIYFTLPLNAFPWVTFKDPVVTTTSPLQEETYNIEYRSYPHISFLMGEDEVPYEIVSCDKSLNWQAPGALSLRLYPSGSPLPTQAKIKWSLQGSYDVAVDFIDSDCDVCQKKINVTVNPIVSFPPLKEPTTVPGGRYKYGE